MLLLRESVDRVLPGGLDVRRVRQSPEDERVPEREDALARLLLARDDARRWLDTVEQLLEVGRLDEVLLALRAMVPERTFWETMEDCRDLACYRRFDVVENGIEHDAGSELFFMPVHGVHTEVRSLVCDADIFHALSLSFRKSGLFSEDCGCCLVPGLLDPEYAATPTPEALADSAEAATRMLFDLKERGRVDRGLAMHISELFDLEQGEELEAEAKGGKLILSDRIIVGCRARIEHDRLRDAHRRKLGGEPAHALIELFELLWLQAVPLRLHYPGDDRGTPDRRLVYGADGSARSILDCDIGGKLRMEGREVFKRAVRAVVAYFGHVPRPRVTIEVRPVRGEGVLGRVSVDREVVVSTEQVVVDARRVRLPGADLDWIPWGFGTKGGAF